MKISLNNNECTILMALLLDAIHNAEDEDSENVYRNIYDKLYDICDER